MSMIEQEIIDRVRRLNDDQKRHVLDYLRQVESAGFSSGLSARDLMKLSPDELQQHIMNSLALAAEEDFETFEAYSEEPLDDLD